MLFRRLRCMSGGAAMQRRGARRERPTVLSALTAARRMQCYAGLRVWPLLAAGCVTT